MAEGYMKLEFREVRLKAQWLRGSWGFSIRPSEGFWRFPASMPKYCIIC